MSAKNTSPQPNKELIIKAIEAKLEYEEARERYQDARAELLVEFDKLGLQRHTTPLYNITRVRSTHVDGKKMKDKYPEIYFIGLECKFSPDKAKTKISHKLVDKVVYECGKGEEYVQIRRRKGNLIQKRTR